jgi:hypothetical protein
MEWIASSLHTASELGVSSITTADAHTSAASSRLNWRPRRFKWTRPFRWKTKSGFCACGITFQTQSTTSVEPLMKQIVSVCFMRRALAIDVQGSEDTSVSYVVGSPKVVIYSNKVSFFVFSPYARSIARIYHLFSVSVCIRNLFSISFHYLFFRMKNIPVLCSLLPGGFELFIPWFIWFFTRRWILPSLFTLWLKADPDLKTAVARSNLADGSVIIRAIPLFVMLTTFRSWENEVLNLSERRGGRGKCGNEVRLLSETRWLKFFEMSVFCTDWHWTGYYVMCAICIQHVGTSYPVSYSTWRRVMLYSACHCSWNLNASRSV